MVAKDNLVMGKNCIYAMDENYVNNNVLIVGGTGSGKTHFVLEPMLLYTENSSAVVNINKRVLFDKYAPLFAKRGYKVLNLNLAHPEQGNVSFNLFEYMKSDKDIRDLAKNIVEVAIGCTDSQRDPYWNISAANLLAFVLHFTRDCYKKPDFIYVIGIIQELSNAFTILHSDKEELSETEERTMKFLEHVDDYAANGCRQSIASGYYTFRSNCRTTGSCIISTLISALDAVFTESVLQVADANSPELSITRIGKEKTILFITVPPLNQSTHIFANIIFGQIFKTLFEYAEDKCPDGELPVPVRLMFDDFACGGIIPGFDKTISIIRQKKISATILLQDFSQLYSMYGVNKAKTIANNCDNLVYMGGMDEASVDKVSRLTNRPFEDIYYMPVDKVIVIRRGNPEAVFTCRYEIEQDDTYKALQEYYAKSKEAFAWQKNLDLVQLP